MKDMEPQDPMEKDQLIEQAIAEIANIQLVGQAIREQIDVTKKRAIDEIEANDRQIRISNTIVIAKRSELIKKMGEAAKTGDFVEMQRIKNLLDQQ